MSHAIHHHLGKLHHHGKKHLFAFKVKHNISGATIALLFALALQINILYTLWMMPIQSESADIPMSFAGSTLVAFSEIIRNLFIAL